MGLIIDPEGCYLDPSRPSRLDTLSHCRGRLNPAERARARAGIALLLREKLSKYNDFAGESRVPEPGFVLVVDQVPGDASLGGAGAAVFQKMLATAISENPGKEILVRRHPQAAHNPALTHFAELSAGIQPFPADICPQVAVGTAHAVYCVSSQLGFDAILAGKRPVMFGSGFYAGRGLTDDRIEMPPRRKLDVETLFHHVMIDLPVWYDPFADELCSFERAVEILAARRSAVDRVRPVTGVANIRLWKRRHVSRMMEAPAIKDATRPGAAIWGGAGEASFRIEDGFLRSVGLGAELVPPLSLALDDLGIYFDSSAASRLERLIASSVDLPLREIERAAQLRERIVALGATKYNLGGGVPELPDRGPVILVPGQVEDDASISKGACKIRTNAALLHAARASFPDAVIAYKPHPDVEAGLRSGAIGAQAMSDADLIWSGVDAAVALEHADRVATMTSAMGFEALLRGVPVTCFGHPFYAGWGLTDDRAGPLPRRTRAVALDGLVHAALIGYPIYLDPVTELHCGPEDIVTRLEKGGFGSRHKATPVLSKVQGAFAGVSWLWRR